MDPEPVVIRRAGLSDATGMAKVHIDTWRTTYRGLIPDDFLNDLSYQKQQAQWERLLGTPDDPRFALVAETPGTAGEHSSVIGFAVGGPRRSTDLDVDGELYAIYVLDERQGRGLGRLLFRSVAGELRARGYRSMLVWVLAGNPFRSFYEAMGGTYLRTQSAEIGGARLDEAAYGWRNLDA